MTTRKPTLSRRRFLFGAAGAAVAIPALPSLLGRSARAGGTEPVRRLVYVYTANGQYRSAWRPTGSETDFTLSPVLEPLADHQDNLTVMYNLRGTSGHAGGHAECLTGRPNGDQFRAAGGPSLDQLLASSLRRTTPLASLELGADVGTGADGMISYSDRGLPIPSITNAAGGFDRVNGVVNVDPAVAAARRARKRTVLDDVMEDYRAVSAGLTADERTLLDAHLELVREQERELANPAPDLDCELPSLSGSGTSFADTVRQHIDNIAAAFTCDVVRVVTLAIGGSGQTRSYSEVGVRDDFHEIAHGNAANAVDSMTAISRWHASQVAYLLDRLAAIPDGDGTVLDNTAVVWGGELGEHSFSHSRESVPMVIAGSCGGALRTGRLLDMAGAHYHRLLLTLAHAMGRPDVTSFGDRGDSVLDTLLA